MTSQNKKIKILIIIEQSAVSYKYFENILIELQKNKIFEITVFNLVHNIVVNDHLKQFCFKVLSLPTNKSYKKQFFEIRKIIKTINPTIIHSHEIIPSFYAAISLITLFSKNLLIFHRHHSFYRNITAKIMEKIAFMRCNLAISVSKASQNMAFLEHPKSKKKIIQLYNGIILNETNTLDTINLDQYKNDFKIVLLSRLRSRKGHDTAITAIEIVKKIIPNIVLFFAGEGDSRKDIEKMISDKKLQGHVILLGDVQNIKSLFTKMDISILPSESEAFNLSILETFACNKLSIATNLPSIAECIINEKTGILIECGNAKQLAEKIIYYLKNENERVEIALNGNKLYNEQFTTSIMVNKLTDIYLKIIGGINLN